MNQTLVANDVELGPERAAEPHYQIPHPDHLSEDEDTWVWIFSLTVVVDVVSVDKLEMEKRTGLSSHVGFESIERCIGCGVRVHVYLLSHSKRLPVIDPADSR